VSRGYSNFDSWYFADIMVSQWMKLSLAHPVVISLGTANHSGDR